jgi:hypothetical protein
MVLASSIVALARVPLGSFRQGLSQHADAHARPVQGILRAGHRSGHGLGRRTGSPEQVLSLLGEKGPSTGRPHRSLKQIVQPTDVAAVPHATGRRFFGKRLAIAYLR